MSQLLKAEIHQTNGHHFNGSNGHPAKTPQRARVAGIGVVGLGYWGPNWIRNLHQLRCTGKIVACDLDAARRDYVSGLYSGLQTSSSFENLLDDPEIEGVVIATPVSSHYRMARRALECNKAVLVEKPLATSVREAAGLIEIARERGRTLMVGHTFEYSAPVLKAKEIISAGEVGEVLYLSSVRANLGLFQHDVNVVWDLATHDVSIMLKLMERQPESISCQGQSHYGNRVEDVALLTLRFAHNVIAFIHVSWLDPNKIRRTTIVGSRKMLVYDDTAAQEKIRIYDKGVSVSRYYDTFGEFQFSYRYGDIQIPRIEEYEPLRAECEHFVDCIATGRIPETDGVNGLRVVGILEAANRSLREGGRAVAIEEVSGGSHAMP
ncbi:MAG TPA: Gfo/Idh/MocA family oxidoreductase [Candidatus Binataceae bacterium]|jgi:predicted dehydrogenase|nr:Gfo/Idh/MocA family oxidoreductase [Candidatus Binataceae bacterium]